MSDRLMRSESYSPVIVIGGGVARVAYSVAPQTETNKMMNCWLKGVAVAALTAVGAVAAQAADLPTRKEAPAPVFVPPPFTWTGFYIGLNAGGIWPSGSRSASLFDPNAGTDGGFLNAGFPGGLGSQSAGFLGGGQAGYNWQTGAFVLGVETDFDGSTVSKSFNNVGAPFRRGRSGALAGDFLSVNGKASLSWLGTTRGRVGFVATPDNRLMIYATGGVAYGGGTSNFSAFDSRPALSGPATPAPPASAGRSAAVLNTRSPTTSRSRANICTPISAAAASTASETLLRLIDFPGVVVSGKIDYNASIFRAGVNYKF